MAQSFTSISADGRRSLAGTTSGFTSEIDEEEIDQLDSGLDDEEEDMEPEVEEDESSSSFKGRRKLGVRVPGHTLVPQDKLDNILQAEGAGAHMSKEAVFMLSVATEEFIKKLAEAGYRQTTSENRQHVQYRDLATLTQRHEFKFLDDTVPIPMSITEAMTLRAAKERELLEDDPAVSAVAPSSPPPMPGTPTGPASSSAAKPKPRTRQSLPAETNGKSRVGLNGSASTVEAASVSAHTHGSVSANESAASVAARQRNRDSNGRWRKGATANGHHSEGTPSSTGTRAGSARIRNRSARAREAAEASHSGSHTAYHNGVLPLTNGRGRSASATSVHQDVNASPESTVQTEQWSPGRFTGPASAYLEDGNRPPILNGRSGSITDNPGRTIYSQQRPPTQPR
ncbi:hypothetical protein C8Q79DRAFT_551981 [Trametes meyenii]|nr:hypothetical protein C8Q79DRAFT_551981 [Trametes meyenii]